MISDNGLRVPRAALREAVMTDAGADFKYVCCQSGLVLIRLVAGLMGAPCGLIASGAESGGAASPPSITTAKPRPQEGDKGVAKLKCTPAPISPCPSAPPHVLLPLQPHCYRLLAEPFAKSRTP